MTNWRPAVTACMLVCLALTLADVAWAEEIGQIKVLTGEVHIVRDNVKLPAKAGDLLEKADAVITGPESSAGIAFIDNSRFSLGPDSSIELEKFRFNPTTHDGEFITKVKRGTLAIISGHIAKRSPDAMKLRTPTTICGVRGTTFLVQVKK